MTSDDQKDVLLHYLEAAREALVWKLDGLSEWDVRRPLTRTGTNLLGLVKHVAMVEAGYLGTSFGRPVPGRVPAFDPSDESADLWATVDESRDLIVELYQRVAANSAGTIEALELEARGTVPHWPEERRHPTLHAVVVHVVAETNRHAGHADIIRESIDGAVGLRPAVPNLPTHDEQWWATYRARLEAVANTFRP